ncbi:MAG: hypothetical protein AAB363_08670 [Planctomycetota bacterium]
MSDAPLVAHSLAEIYLYILATPCGSCGRGPLRGGEAEPYADPAAGMTVGVAATCGSCQSVTRWKFKLPGPPQAVSADQAPVVNSTNEPSRMLDVAQWLTLFRMMTEAAGKELNKPAARRLALEAAQCLDEALKFFEEDNDLPAKDAFFHDGSRERFRDHPEQFSRQRLLHLRSKLPTRWLMRPGGE